MKNLALKIAAVCVAGYTLVFKLLFILFYGFRYLTQDFVSILFYSVLSFILIYFAFLKKPSTLGEPKADGLIGEKFDYYHEHAGTAIGVKKEKSEIYLKNGRDEKIYSFSDIRKWESNIQSNDTYRGYGMAGIAASASAASQNKKNTGLFINVKDVDHPMWTVRFKIDSKIDQNMSKWMEILQQYINES